jgi:L-2-hydroxycarboxylate dehydrogenase (NAD+)
LIISQSFTRTVYRDITFNFVFEVCCNSKVNNYFGPYPLRGMQMEKAIDRSERFTGAHLRDFASKVFECSGIGMAEAVQAADVLCTADEWGIRSHGLARLRFYREMIAEGRIKARAKPRVAKDLPSMALVDGDNGLGLVVGSFANRIAMEKARRTGIGWVNVINSNHFGIAGYYTVQGLVDGLIGFSMTNTPPLVSPFGGVERMLGTNPISISFPTMNERPIVIDMATSAISLGSVENANREGCQLPPFCVANSVGEPSIDPQDLFENGSLLPLGGDRLTGGHKGYCLASLVDLLCGVVPGASWGPFVPPFINDTVTRERNVGKGIGHLFGSIWTGAFEDSIDVRVRTDDWIKTMRNTKPAAWSDGVMIPGDPEYAAAIDSLSNGVKLDLTVQEDLRRLANELGISFD